MSKPILAWVTRHPPTPRQRRDFADANADLEVRDVTERLNCCEDDDERDALVRRWLHVRGAA